MSINFNFELTDNSDLVKKACHEQIVKALEMVGIQAESDIKNSMTEVWPETDSDIVDTGRLRNSDAGLRKDVQRDIRKAFFTFLNSTIAILRGIGIISMSENI